MTEKESVMLNTGWGRKAAIIAVPLIFLAGCASQADLDALRSDVDKLRAQVTTAESRAMKAEHAAAISEAEAKAASKKADQIYRESLRK
jgi:outer membrane murein-binding lipoprotein Lpp